MEYRMTAYVLNLIQFLRSFISVLTNIKLKVGHNNDTQCFIEN